MRSLRYALVVAAFAGCVIQTNRTQGLGDGEIHGTAVRKDGKPARGAVVALAGSSRVTSADKDGNFVFTGLVPGSWLVHISEDDEGDGVAERAAFIPTLIKFVPVPKNATDGCTGAPPEAVTTQLLGKLTLADTKHVTGHVTRSAAAALASDVVRVVVWRDIDGHQAPIEAAAGVKADGSYDVGGVAPGTVNVAAFAFLAPDFVKPLFYGSATGDAGSTVDVTVDQPARTDADQTKLRTASVQLEAQWNSPKTRSVAIDLVNFLPPDEDDANPIDQDQNQFALDDQTKAIVLDVPVGVIDIAVQSSTDGASQNTLRGAVIVPGVAILGPLELPVFIDPCHADSDAGALIDCNHNGVPGLGPPAGPPDPRYHACNADCAGTFGADGAGATCGADHTDCDDDGDGQPDVTEPPNCIGPGKGTDLDGDGLCEPNADPFPLCAANDPLTCPDPFTPPPALY